jgi:hypothetical protein
MNDPISAEEYFRGTLKVIAHWSEVDLSGEWETGLRGVIRSITDAAKEVLSAHPENPGAAKAEPATVAADLDGGDARPNRRLDSSDRGHTFHVAQRTPPDLRPAELNKLATEAFSQAAARAQDAAWQPKPMTCGGLANEARQCFCNSECEIARDNERAELAHLRSILRTPAATGGPSLSEAVAEIRATAPNGPIPAGSEKPGFNAIKREEEICALEAEVSRLREEIASYAGQNTNLRNDLVLMGMARDQALSQVEDARKSLQIADQMVSDHIERFHDYDYRPEEQPPELASLHQIEHHLMGSLILDGDISSVTSTVSAPGRPDWCQGADPVCHHPACVCVIPPQERQDNQQ